MKILVSDIEGYQKLRGKSERLLAECQALTDFPSVHKNMGINLGRDYADIYIAYEEFQNTVLLAEKMSSKEYTFKVGILEGRIKTRMKSIQTVASTNLNLKNKVEQFLIAKNAVVEYLLEIAD